MIVCHQEHYVVLVDRGPVYDEDPVVAHAAEAAGLARASRRESAVSSAAWMQSGMPTPS